MRLGVLELSDGDLALQMANTEELHRIHEREREREETLLQANFHLCTPYTRPCLPARSRPTRRACFAATGPWGRARPGADRPCGS